MDRVIFRIINTVCIGLFISVSLLSQEDSFLFNDKVRLKNGSVYSGEIVRISNDTVALQLRSGFVVLIPGTSISKVAQFHEESPISQIKHENFLEFGDKWFFGLDVGMGFGNRISSWHESTTVFDFSFLIRNRFAEKHFSGARANFKNLIIDNIVPKAFDLHLSYEYLFNDKRKIAPFIGLRGGPSMIINEREANISPNGVSYGGGVFLGYYLSLGRRSAFRSEVGYMVQNYKYQFDQGWGWPPGNIQRNVNIRTITLRIGYIF